MFLPMTSQPRLIPGSGPTSAKIAIVGDYTTNFDRNAMKPFAGPNGIVLKQCLHAAGLIRGEVYITNLFKEKETRFNKLPRAPNNFFNEATTTSKMQFTAAGESYVDFLRAEIDKLDANVVVACGRAASLALCGIGAISTYRGYVFSSLGLKVPRKIIPTQSPADAIRGMYTYRHMIVCDLKKASEESKFRELVRPDRQLIYDFANVEEALQWLEYLEDSEELSYDIEVINFEVSCMSFSNDPKLAVVIPIADRWTEEEEVLIWRAIQKVLGSDCKKVGQNLIFDNHFLLTRNGIVVNGPIEDTMIGHSVMYPELPKGLGFLGSIYCGAQAYWKDTVKFNNIKEES